jgi:hypothetical protein
MRTHPAAAAIVLHLRRSADLDLLLALAEDADDATLRSVLSMLGDFDAAALAQLMHCAVVRCRAATARS